MFDQFTDLMIDIAGSLEACAFNNYSISQADITTQEGVEWTAQEDVVTNNIDNFMKTILFE